MNYSRIDYAIHVLKTAPKPGKFNMWNWMKLGREEKKRYNDGECVALNGCGTTGCAIGWIASDPLVRNDGFHLTIDDVGDNSILPYYRGDVGEYAAAEYFGIHVETAEMLFFPTQYPNGQLTNPKYVIERLELLLAAGEALFMEMMDGRARYDYL